MCKCACVHTHEHVLKSNIPGAYYVVQSNGEEQMQYLLHK